VEANILSPSRTTVVKATPSKLPMRFKTHLPDDFAEHQKFYMQLSDSDDDDVPERATKALRRTVVASGKGGAKKGAAGKPEIAFKHERPVDRERPVSAKMFHTVSANDSEFKVRRKIVHTFDVVCAADGASPAHSAQVHYRHTNYRRMPLTPAQEQWLDERENLRVKKSEEAAAKLVEDAAKKADKKGGKGGKDDKKDGKDKGGKGGKKSAAAKPEEVKVKSKYLSATHAMTALFPNFEDESDPTTLGPMRTMQLVEVDAVLNAFQDAAVPIKESVLRKALLIPQDRPEAICLEGLREEKEDLMVNPLPRELWRKAAVGKKGGGKKGKKKKG
jgi:hypothetical protein